MIFYIIINIKNKNENNKLINNCYYLYFENCIDQIIESIKNTISFIELIDDNIEFQIKHHLSSKIAYFYHLYLNINYYNKYKNNKLQDKKINYIIKAEDCIIDINDKIINQAKVISINLGKCIEDLPIA